MLACDADVAAISKVSDWRSVKLAGGGGTDMGAGIQRASGLKPRPNLIFVFTDGATPWPQKPPPRTKVLVGVVGAEHYLRQVPRWAKAVSIDMNPNDGLGF